MFILHVNYLNNNDATAASNDKMQMANNMVVAFLCLLSSPIISFLSFDIWLNNDCCVLIIERTFESILETPFEMLFIALTAPVSMYNC